MIYAGGIWSIAVMVALAFGYAKVFGARRRIYVIILGIAASVIAISQLLLASSHLFHQSVRDDLIFLLWAGYVGTPVAVYTLFIRWARHKAKVRHDA